MVVAAAVLSALVFGHVTLLECTTMNTMSKTIPNATQMIGLQAPLPSEEDRDPRGQEQGILNPLVPSSLIRWADLAVQIQLHTSRRRWCSSGREAAPERDLIPYHARRPEERHSRP
jgi:hypothetical protein